jgi:glycosyltransferase involved in cell wall biosynthesis
MPILSICIPTYNRSRELKDCISSIIASAHGYENNIEIIVSDDAGTDNTKEIVTILQKNCHFLKYHKNIKNTRDGNFYILANMASGKYIWIFGDDDKMAPNAVGTILKLIESDYNPIICNYSIWSKDFSHMINSKYFHLPNDKTIREPNDLMRNLGLKLGLISCVIIKKKSFIILPKEEYEPFLSYGFSFLYSIYTAMLYGCYAYFVSEPIILYRGSNSNSDKDWWYKCFVTGSSLIFEELIKKGYSKEAVFRAKHSVIKDYVMHDISFRRRNGEKLNGLFSLMLPFYKRHWFFWIVCVPMLFLPKFFICMGNKIVNKLRFRCI